MKLSQLLIKHKNKDIISRLIELYPDQKKSATGYRKVLKNLRSTEPAKHEGNMYISIYHVIDDTDKDDVEEYDRVSGIEDNESYAIEFMAWNKWVDMEIAPSSEFSEVDIIVHCLWEMTCSGFEEEQIQNKLKIMHESIPEIEKYVKK